MQHSRTYNSIRNALVALGFYFLNLILQFISRKVFIDHLGSDLLGLNTTITSILQFLNITEMGIGTAIACTLYTPLRDGNQRHINEIISLQGWVYKRIACVVLVSGMIVMLLFPWIFGKESLPLWYAYATFGVMLFGSILNYTFTYKQVLLSANQQEYKIQLSYKLSMLAKLSIQILAVKYLPHGYIWWLGLEFLFAIIASLAVNHHVRCTFPYLTSVDEGFKELNAKHPSIKSKVSQLFFHKIAAFALSQISPIILYGFTTLAMVTKYGNYMLIVMGLQSLMMALFNGLNAGVGDLVAEGNRERIFGVFRELFASRFLLSFSLSLCVLFLSDSFVELWVGREYVLERSSVILISIILFINTLRSVVDSYIQAYGLFKDIWAPIAEAALNIGLSILFGHLWGLNGILLGVVISLLAIVCIWKPYLLFKQGLHRPIGDYVAICAKLLVVGGALIYPLGLMVDASHLAQADSYIQFIGNGALMLFATLTTTGLAIYITESGMRQFVARCLTVAVKLKK